MKTTTDEQTMRDYFTQFGTVDNVDILVDKATKRRRGFAYVTFTDSDPVDKAVCKKLSCMAFNWLCMDRSWFKDV